MKKKYLVIGGEIASVNDGDIHYVGALRLCSLYGVSPVECILVEEGDPLLGICPENYIVLHPRWEHEEYRLP